MTLDEAFARAPTFTTPRLLLRPMELSDAEAIYEIKPDPLVTSQYGAEPHSSLDQTRRWVEEGCVAAESATRSSGSAPEWVLNGGRFVDQLYYSALSVEWGGAAGRSP